MTRVFFYLIGGTLASSGDAVSGNAESTTDFTDTKAIKVVDAYTIEEKEEPKLKSKLSMFPIVKKIVPNFITMNVRVEVKARSNP